MPYGDRTGPIGAGQMTGRGLGFCAGYEVPVAMQGRGFGYGYGRGMGRGRGMGPRGGGRGFGMRGGWHGAFAGWGPAAQPGGEYLRESLKQQAKHLEAELKAISARIEALDAADAQDQN